MRKVLKVVGKPWYRAIMDKIIRSARPIFESGHQILFRYSKESVVYEKILNEYLAVPEEGASTRMFLPLDPNKPRVKKLLGELTKNIDVNEALERGL
jgi:hypothetical protein